MPTAPRMNKPQGGYDFWADTLQPGLFGLYDRWTEQKPWPTPAQIDAAVQNPGLLDRDVMAGYAVDMAQPFAAKLGGLLAHGAMPPGGLFGITTWHGSPHKWTRPDISKVGTGEGAQAYGHGFYSADARGVAQGYRDKLTNRGAYSVDGVPQKESTVGRDPAIYEIAVNDGDDGLRQLLKAADDEITAARAMGWSDDDLLDALDRADRIEELIGKKVTRAQGHLYKLDIPDEDVARYLDWDKPLSDQGEDIRNLAKAIGLPEEIDGHGLLGRALYEHIAQSNIKGFKPSQDIASEMLLDAGIPGIRYLDGSSRSAGEGTYNYVTFDPSRIKVLERNGEDLQGLLGR